MSDRFRPVFSKRDGPSLIMVPELSLPFDQAQKLYFLMPKSDGSSEAVVSVKVFFRNRVIVGIVFTYPSGKVAKAGNTRTRNSATACFEAHCRIFSLAVRYNKESKPQGIEFEVESVAEFETEMLRFCVEALNDQTPEALIGYHRREVWWRNALATKSQQWPSFLNGNLMPPPKSKLVGIYVRCQVSDSLELGGVYEPEGEEASGLEDSSE
ncbi:uncharacterized protein N7483_001999 [Penicillium malachiteum]|uniref:uncharacterized protein n=1 Tax=Penicillium malachiteum TaxID=1324776 RepID=UPI0025473E5E|nr:uncharacterized protein N7483_001999 [Penicillium malachiteum]KAJ5736874.1 hypothetical protein N7483_001999 [Penicillium malachiteum]